MQTENLANNSHKQFFVFLNTNQIKLYSYPDFIAILIFYLENFSTQN